MGSQALFPPSSDGELLALRRRCAMGLWSLLPRGVGRLYFGSSRPQSIEDPSSVGGHGCVGRDQHPRPSSLPRTDPSIGVASPPNRDPKPPTGLAKASQQQQQQERPPVPSPKGANRTIVVDMSASGPETSGGSLPPDAAPVDSANDTAASLDPEDERIVADIESGILDVFSDAYCNKHLMYGVLELLLVRLMPELADRGVIELLSERL